MTDAQRNFRNYVEDDLGIVFEDLIIKGQDVFLVTQWNKTLFKQLGNSLRTAF